MILQRIKNLWALTKLDPIEMGKVVGRVTDTATSVERELAKEAQIIPYKKADPIKTLVEQELV